MQCRFYEIVGVPIATCDNPTPEQHTVEHEGDEKVVCKDHWLQLTEEIEA